MSFLSHDLINEPWTIKSEVGGRESVHVFDLDCIEAINAALAAGRPLLVRGEPGVGKSQLARAAASASNRAFRSLVINASTEPSDLLWKFDTVARLAEAQLCAAQASSEGIEDARARLQTDRFLQPGPLWWAFDWKDAQNQLKQTTVYTSDQQTPENDHTESMAKKASTAGTVVLIDEIDKAESDVPNGLLEALGDREFTPHGKRKPVVMTHAPLLIVTTNEERKLPDPFVRRCLVLHLKIPDERTEPEKLVKFFVSRGEAHFSDMPKDLLNEAAQMLKDDRFVSRGQGGPLPGLAEYLDLLRAVYTRAKNDVKQQRTLLNSVRRYTFQKHQASLKQ